MTDAQQRNWVYDAMNGAHDAAVKEIQALHRLSTRLACDAAPLEALKAVVRNAWGNVTHAVSEFSLSEADPQVLTARARITAIATRVQAMQKTLNMLALKRDEERLVTLFEGCTDNLEKPTAKSPREAYTILYAMRKQAWDYLHKIYKKEESRPTLDAIVSPLDGFVSTASAELDALDPKTPDKAQALDNHADIHRAFDRIRRRQAERQRQDSSDPIPSMAPAERLAPRVQGGAPFVHQPAQICALLAQLEHAAMQ
jgi:hypothetical protein